MKKRTPRVEAIIASAEEIAESYGHGFIGTEHLLLAITNDYGGIASRVRSDLAVREEVARRLRAIIESDGYREFLPPQLP